MSKPFPKRITIVAEYDNATETTEIATPIVFDVHPIIKEGTTTFPFPNIDLSITDPDRVVGHSFQISGRGVRQFVLKEPDG